MWGDGNGSMAMHHDGQSQLSSSYRVFTEKCHVLVVDNNSEALHDTTAMLQSCFYQVTAVESGQHALSMLTKRKQRFDLLLTDFHLVDSDVFVLLQEAFNMNIPTVFMLVEEDPVIARTSIESGVCFLLEKPTTWNAVKTLWQYAMRDRSQKPNDNGRYIVNAEENLVDEDNELVEAGGRKMKNIVPKKKGKNEKGMAIDGTWEVQKREKSTRPSKKKACTAWTDELHAKFISAINQLGEGRCYPKEILHLMNVVGLTRMQVASHLQKCRNDNWRAPESRKSNGNHIQANITNTDLVVSSTDQPERSRICTRKFGSMPRLGKSSIQYPTHDQLSSQISMSETQEFVPHQETYPPLVNMMVSDQGNYRIHEFSNSINNNQMETNYLEAGNMMMLSDNLNPRMMETNVVDHGNYAGGHQQNMMLVGRENSYAGLEENSNMFITNHHTVESSYNMEPHHHGGSSHQNAMVDDFFSLLPEVADPSQPQSYAKVLNYGSTSNNCNFEPFLFNQHHGY